MTEAPHWLWLLILFGYFLALNGIGDGLQAIARAIKEKHDA